ncbi:MAG: hypothetical protein BWY87_00967 [Deltaproteobacteria bacterium ADurb.Bin510]|nr:MAG: hypothetical protein BWY87_00967 [Deltaproteobacteria bacterium ADurb.Bin510]
MWQVAEELKGIQDGIRITKLNPDVTLRRGVWKADEADNDSYMKQIFNLYPELVITDKASIKMKMTAFDNELSYQDYGKIDNPGFTEKQIDSYNILSIEQLYGDVTTDYGRFIFGKTPEFTGVGYFIKLPNLDKWAFGIIHHKKDEDENGIFDIKSSSLVRNTAQIKRQLNSDDYDEDGYILVAKYDSDKLDMTAKLIYGCSGGDNAESNIWRPEVKLNYVNNNLKLDGFARYANGTYSAAFGNKNANVLYRYRSIMDTANAMWQTMNAAMGSPCPTNFLAQAMTYSFEQPFTTYTDLTYHSAFAVYGEASYRFDDLLDTPVTPIVTLAYASGAKRPDQVDGWFNDEMTFGTWLMDDREEEMSAYFVSPSTGYMLEDPAVHPFDKYSFTNIILARLGATFELTKKTSLEANVIWAEKANVDYLKNYNYEFGIGNLPNSNATKISLMGQYDANTDVSAGTAAAYAACFDPSDKQKNNVKRGLGTEINGTLKTQFNENFSLAWQASYLTAGEFYKSAFEPAVPFATAAEVARYYNDPTRGYIGSGLEVEPEWGLRWILQINF